ncbi:DUF4184 family protein [Luteolibacter arcticus]|uniref:DUF4184 family protein n=1 Tax=Luteolibacter arcticus TaxID=1581411 RepID=A0ABT3GE95_9BACT|nr:DUF4184 family protein [Luteolibacter arcticus]MCW1921946.1 DUF4184 family protein [Luteolibacter arcticus]
MPFTISHTVAVIPFFRWRRLDPLALVIGSMAPDFGYFVHRFAFAGGAHSFTGSFTRALPVAALVWLVCRLAGIFLIRPLPPRLRAMVAVVIERSRWQASSLLWVPLSLLLGIWSHNAWDSFTHQRGWVVSRVPLLEWPVYHWLQHASSIVGMVILAIVYRKLGGQVRLDVKDGNARLLAMLAVVAVLAALFPAWNFASQYEGARQWRVFVFREVVYSMSVWACGYLAYALLLQARVWKWKFSR